MEKIRHTIGHWKRLLTILLTAAVILSSMSRTALSVEAKTAVGDDWAKESLEEQAGDESPGSSEAQPDEDKNDSGEQSGSNEEEQPGSGEDSVTGGEESDGDKPEEGEEPGDDSGEKPDGMEEDSDEEVQGPESASEEEEIEEEETIDVEEGMEEIVKASRASGGKKTYEEALEEILELMKAGDNIASGKVYDVYWVIDRTGKLTVTGKGEIAPPMDFPYHRSPWYEDREKIKTAEINLWGTANASFMFYDCGNLIDIDLRNFDTSEVTDMSSMFSCCTNLPRIDLSGFDTSNVTNMSEMFAGGLRKNSLTSLDLSSFDTSNVADMGGMFISCGKLESIDLSSFDTSNVTDMSAMFSGCKSLTTLDLRHFNTANVTDMSDMFFGCYKLLSLDISSFNTSKVTNMGRMFAWCYALTSLDVSHFDTSNVTDMGTGGRGDVVGMFSDCEALTELDVSHFNTSKVTSMNSMFSGCGGLTSLDVSSFDTSKVTDMKGMFSGCGGLTSLDVSHFDTSNVTNMQGMFLGCTTPSSLDVSHFDTGNVTDMRAMFAHCRSLSSLDVSHFDTGNVTDMSQMFVNCKTLSSLDLSHFDTGNVIYMGLMFYNCIGLTSVDVSGFNTSKVTHMTGMFANCSSLTSLDVSHFDTSKVDAMSAWAARPDSILADLVGMFSGCEGLTSLDVSHFDTSNVTYMAGIFKNCSSLTSLDVSSFDTSNATAMESMFEGCENLKNLDVSNFDTSKVTTMDSMFRYCRSLKSLDLEGFDAGKVTDAGSMLAGCQVLTRVYTPRNLSTATELPGYGEWYMPGGKQITTLPQNLSYSIIVTRDQAPESAESIKVNKEKTVYVCGEELTLDDLKVSYCGADGTVKQVTDYTTNKAEINMSVPGRKILRIFYKGMTAEVEIRVTCDLAKSAVSITLMGDSPVYAKLPVTPEVRVTVTVNKTAVTLSEGRDYSLSYENNINAGNAAKIIVRGQGEYSGSIVKNFTIQKAPLEITASDITFILGDPAPNAEDYVYRTKGLFKGDKLTKRPSFTCGVDMAKPGSYTITPYGADAGPNYAIIYKVGTLTVVDAGVYHTVRFDLSGHGTNLVMRGIKAGSLLREPPEPQDPETAGYLFAGWYKDQTYAAKQKWNFAADTVQEDMTLYACWISMASEGEKGMNLCVQDILPQTYTGSQIKPVVNVYDSSGNTLLKAGRDYTISYHNNIDSDAVKFESGQIPAGGTGNLLEDGSISTSAGFHKSLAYVTIKGKGNYKGTICRNFHIERAVISKDKDPAAGITLKWTENLVYTDKKEQKPFGSLKYKKAMTAGRDYTVTLSAEAREAYSGKAADGTGVLLQRKWTQAGVGKTLPAIPKGYYGTFKLTVEGIGNYDGVIEKRVIVSADRDHLMKNASVMLGKDQKKVANVTREELEKGITLTPAYYDISEKKYYLLDEKGEFTGETREKPDDVFTVKFGKTYLKCGRDYVIDSYTGNHAVGKATLHIRGIGDYVGSKSITFTIAGAAFRNLAVEGLEDMSYTGRALTQSGVLLTNGKDKTDADYKAFVYGTDYTISYKNNIKKGTAVMTFTARPESGYSGSFKKTFKITAADLNQSVNVSAADPGDRISSVNDTLSFSGVVYYSKEGAKLTGRIRLVNRADTELVLKESTDYTIKYTNNKAVTKGSEAVMTITGKGNYRGTITVKFAVVRAPISAVNKNLALSASAVFFDGKKTKYESKIKLTDGKKTLAAGDNKDYTVVGWRNNTKEEIAEYLRLLRAGAGVAEEKRPQVTVSGNGGYEGKRTIYFDVYDTKLSADNVYIIVSDDPDGITYTGGVLTPEVSVYYSKDAQSVKEAKNAGERNEALLTGHGDGKYGLTKLANREDYTLIWGNNLSAGTGRGSVKVTGTGLYGGSITSKFNILSRDIFSR